MVVAVVAVVVVVEVVVVEAAVLPCFSKRFSCEDCGLNNDVRELVEDRGLGDVLELRLGVFSELRRVILDMTISLIKSFSLSLSLLFRLVSICLLAVLGETVGLLLEGLSSGVRLVCSSASSTSSSTSFSSSSSLLGLDVREDLDELLCISMESRT